MQVFAALFDNVELGGTSDSAKFRCGTRQLPRMIALERSTNAHYDRLAVSVVVCAYSQQRWEQTCAAVDSVLCQQPSPVQVLLVIDHNSALAERARRELPSLLVLESDDVPGTSGARNSGLRAASQPITVFLDDDAEARPGWLAALIEPYGSPDVVATGGSVHPRWPERRPTWLSPAFDWAVGCSYLGLPDSIGVVRNPIGANMSVQTRLALDVGGFDTGLGRVGTRPVGCEETDLAMRLTASRPGSVVLYVPSAAVDHHVARERLRFSYFLRRCWHEGLSKAILVRRAGSSAGLERERRHVATVIPAALFQELRRAAGGDLDALPRVIAVLGGLTAAVAGYLTGRTPLAAPRQSRRPAFPSEFMKSSAIRLPSHERNKPMNAVILTARRGRRREPLPSTCQKTLPEIGVKAAGGGSPKDRIVVVGSGWHFSSGISHYTYRLSTALTEEYPVSALLMRRLVPWRLYPGRQHVGAPVVNVNYSADVPVYDGVDWYWGPSITNALRYLDRQRPTVVVFQWWTGAVLHTYLRLARHAVKLGARIILEWHEGQDAGEITRPGARRYVRTLMPRLLSRVDAHVVHSNFDLRAIKASYPLDNAIVHIIPHGPYDHLVQSPTNPVVHDASGPMHLLYLGVVRPFKGVEDLITAFGALDSDQADKFRLSIVGETWEGWNAPGHAIERNPHANLIERVDRYITDTELAAYFDWADAVVLPYHRSSASGPLHIAMSAGLPVIVTAVGGLIEAVQDYPGALLVPPRDPMALRDALLEVLAYRGRRYPDPHSWRRTIVGYQTLIDQLHDAVPRRVMSGESGSVR